MLLAIDHRAQTIGFMDFLWMPQSYASIYHFVAYFNYAGIYVWIGMLCHFGSGRFVPFVWTLLFSIAVTGVSTAIAISSYGYADEATFIFMPNGPAFFGEGIQSITFMSTLMNLFLFGIVFVTILQPQIKSYFGNDETNPSESTSLENFVSKTEPTKAKELAPDLKIEDTQ